MDITFRSRKVSSHRNRSLKARTKQTQTELLVQMDDNSKIIVANYPLNYRQRRRRSSQTVSRSVDSEERELICKTPTIVLQPAERASTPKSSCSEDDDSLNGEDITEKDMIWLTQITEQPVVTPLREMTQHSESELDDSNDNLLLPYNTMNMSISPLPPTPSMQLENEINKETDNSKDVSTQSKHYMSDDDLLKECHLIDSPAAVHDDIQNVEESTLISSHQLNDVSDNVVVSTDSANSLLEKAAGKIY